MHALKLILISNFCTLALLCPVARGADESAAANGPQGEPMPIVASDDFEKGAEQWRILDPSNWRVEEHEGNRVLSQHVREGGEHEPPHRSPYHIALLKDVYVTDFELTARVRSTIPDYNHRDVCLFFGFQNPSHFYYVHLGKETDPTANQIFIVNDAPRTKISEKTTEGTPWDDKWHTVRIVRKVDDGAIEVYWDNQKEPIMVAHDKTFTWGQVGVGSFDDTAVWDDVVVRGEVPKPPLDHVLPDAPRPVERVDPDLR